MKSVWFFIFVLGIGLGELDSQETIEVIPECEMSFYKSQELFNTSWTDREQLLNFSDWLKSGEEDRRELELVSLRLMIQAKDVSFNEHACSLVYETSINESSESEFDENLQEVTKKENLKTSFEIIRLKTSSEVKATVVMDGVFVDPSKDGNEIDKTKFLRRVFQLEDGKWLEVREKIGERFNNK